MSAADVWLDREVVTMTLDEILLEIDAIMAIPSGQMTMALVERLRQLKKAKRRIIVGR